VVGKEAVQHLILSQIGCDLQTEANSKFLMNQNSIEPHDLVLREICTSMAHAIAALFVASFGSSTARR